MQLDASKAAEMMAAEELALAASAIQAARKEAAEGVAAASAAQDAAAAQSEELTEKSSRLAHLEGARTCSFGGYRSRKVHIKKI